MVIYVTAHTNHQLRPCEDAHFPLPKNVHKEMAIKLRSGIIPETLMEGMLNNTKSISNYMELV